MASCVVLENITYKQDLFKEIWDPLDFIRGDSFILDQMKNMALKSSLTVD